MPRRTSRVQLEERVLEYDREAHRITVKRISEITLSPDQYWIVRLGDDSERWDIYADEAGDRMWAQTPEEESPSTGHFVSRLDLRNIGTRGRFYRRCGKLQLVYVLKPLGYLFLSD
ncbi:uncharacterized protein F4807DRAFT_455327 [Annulohypoxylon truncatum]|uniref:uncharacterized protein n=1 Tax=Annulohypoxylon truncatum TaxID=327061 RepID=UPI0020088B1E|nr:uncharacterized protein F4807DRAFT_455327 [Annulohypoxylon truncatum]KAI1214876.1 hypothetical protein F4807DRAFT_455327 [Annulohypoxylon truncatum]